ncbi:hypothetical protein NEAUS04_0851 [Nematocida ausubeli]|nr:hypothetical protein NEAUS04_0851 [Nematocida ausubeli]
MKRKTGVEPHRKEHKKNAEENDTRILEEEVQAPVQPAEPALESTPESMRDSAGDSRSLIETARSTLARLLTIMWPEVGVNALRSPGEQPSRISILNRPSSSQAEEAVQATEREEWERLENTNMSRYIPVDAFRAIMTAVQSVRGNPHLYDSMNSVEVDTFFDGSASNNPPPDPNSPHARSIVFTITYYIEDPVSHRKTIGKEDLDEKIPEVSADGSEGECPICLVDIEKEEIIRKLHCMHTFHSECVSEWLTNYSNECPMCRKEAVAVAIEESPK